MKKKVDEIEKIVSSGFTENGNEYRYVFNPDVLRRKLRALAKKVYWTGNVSAEQFKEKFGFKP